MTLAAVKPRTCRALRPVRRRTRLGAVVVTLVGLLLLSALAPLGSGQQEATIQIEDNSFGQSFSPSEVTVGPASTVWWRYDQPTAGAHTVTSTDSLDNKQPNGLFDQQLRGQGESMAFSFDTPGVVAFYCRFHPDTMSGRVIVTTADGELPPEAGGGNGIPGWHIPLGIVGLLGATALAARWPGRQMKGAH